MAIEAELADGRVLEFPDGTSNDVIQATVKKMVAQGQPQPKGSPLPANAGLANFMATALGLPVDTITNALNLGLASIGTAATAAGRPDMAPSPIEKPFGGSESIRSGLRATGMPGLSPDNPNPKSESGTLQYDMMARGGFIPGGVIPAAGSIVAEKVAGPEYAAVGAMLPQAAAQAAGAAKRAVADPKVVQQNVETFRQAGTRPDVAQATDSNFFRGLMNVVGRVPGGQGVIAKFREMEQEALGRTAKTGVSAETAGRAVKSGIVDEGGFIARTKNQWKQLDDEVAAKIPEGSTFAPTNTVKALDDLTASVKGAEKTTGALVNSRIAEIKKNLTDDLAANNGAMPFEAVRALRSRVGELLDDSLVSGIPNGQMKKLYGALSQDLEAAATQAGAGSEFARQNNYYRARMERIENTLDKVLGKGKNPEDIFKSVAPTDVESVSTIRRVMRSLDPEQRQIVSNAIVNRMGRAAPGKQDATTDKFSSETFLSNWSRMNDSAKSQIFSDPSMRMKLDAIANASSGIREGKTPFGNPSGTGQAATAAAVYGSVPAAAALAATGNVGAAAGALTIAGGMVAGANISAKMLTSPKVVDWLAKAPRAQTAEQVTARLGQLAVIYNETRDPELKADLAEYIGSLDKK